jgi:hypothetical protein
MFLVKIFFGHKQPLLDWLSKFWWDFFQEAPNEKMLTQKKKKRSIRIIKSKCPCPNKISTNQADQKQKKRS